LNIVSSISEVISFHPVIASSSEAISFVFKRLPRHCRSRACPQLSAHSGLDGDDGMEEWQIATSPCSSRWHKERNKTITFCPVIASASEAISFVFKRLPRHPVPHDDSVIYYFTQLKIFW